MRNSITKVVVMILIFATGLCAIELTEDKAVEMAIERSRELKLSEQNLRSAYGKLFEGISAFLPRVTLGASYTKLSEPQIKISGPAAAMMGAFPPTLTSDELYSGNVSIIQPIFMWGRSYQANRQSRLSYTLAREKLRQQKSDIIFRAKEHFYRALLAEKMLTIAREGFELSENRYNTTVKLHTEGRASSYDVSRSKVAASNARVLLLKAENSARLAKEAIKMFLNISDTEDVRIKGEFESDRVEKKYNLENLIADAINFSPKIKQAELQGKLAKSFLSMARGLNKPLLMANYNYSLQSADISDPFELWDKRWQAGLSLQWNLFDGLATQGRVIQAEAALEQANISNKVLIDGIKFEARAAYISFTQAKQTIAVQKENVLLARQNLDTAQKRYAMGLMSLLELQDVNMALTQADINYQQAMYDYNISLATIEKLTAR